MSISYVLRLRQDALADGRFVGEIEAVADAQRRVVKTMDQMAEFILETGQPHTEPELVAQPVDNRAA